MKTNITIAKPFGKWTINGKSYNECNYIERQYFQLYLNSHKNQEILKTA